MNRVFFDMDGTLFVFNREKTLDEVMVPGYFRDLEPIPNMVECLHQLYTWGMGNLDVYILSAVLPGEHFKNDKLYSISNVMPWFPKERVLFARCGVPKNADLAVKMPTDILVDDLTANLKDWHGVGIKYYNGINGNNGTWNGYSIDYRTDGTHLARQIEAIAKYEGGR